jgi:ubiquinone biosynthesis protein COQ4
MRRVAIGRLGAALPSSLLEPAGPGPRRLILPDPPPGPPGGTIDKIVSINNLQTCQQRRARRIAGDPSRMAATTDSASLPSTRIRPLVAVRALRALLRDPDDTARVFDVVEALSGNTRERVFARFLACPSAPRLLAERPNLLAVLSERARLLALPEGTLGRTYAEFMTREQISADGLVDASAQWLQGEIPAERRWFGDRLRDMHDLWHVVTGYDRDLVGEASLLAFTLAQTRNPGIAVIVGAAYLEAGRVYPGARALMREGYRRGKRADWLPAVEWEALLEQPLVQVRRDLRVGDPPVYVPLRSEGAPVLAA